MSWNEIKQEINTNIADNDHQLITAEKVRTTLLDIVGQTETVENEISGVIDVLNDNFRIVDDNFNNYYTKSVIDDKFSDTRSELDVLNEKFDNYYTKNEIDNKIASVNDAVNALDETCARKKYIGVCGGDFFTLSTTVPAFRCFGFYYTVEEATVEDYEQQPKNGLCIRCNFRMEGHLDLIDELGTFFKNISPVILNFSVIRDKALELSGFDKNDYAQQVLIVSSDACSYKNNKLIFVLIQNNVLNCFSAERLTDASIGTNVTTEFYMIKQNND